MNLSWSILFCVCVVFCLQWKSLSSKEKDIYFTEAEKRRQVHQKENPGWTNKDNYVSTSATSFQIGGEKQMCYVYDVCHQKENGTS